MTSPSVTSKRFPLGFGKSGSIRSMPAGWEQGQQLRRLSRPRCNPTSRCNRTACCFTRRRFRTDATLRLYSWSLLSAAAGECMAGVRRITGFGISLSRLERTHHRGMLRPEWYVENSGWLPEHREDHKQLRVHQFQFWSDFACVDGGKRTDGVPDYSQGR